MSVEDKLAEAYKKALNEKKEKMYKLIITYDLDEKDKIDDLKKDLRKVIFKHWVHLQGSVWVGYSTKYNSKQAFDYLKEHYSNSDFSVSNISESSVYHNGRLPNNENEENSSKNGDIKFPKS